MERSESRTDVVVPPEEAASHGAAEPGHVRPAVVAGPTWAEAFTFESGDVQWQVMTRGHYWAGRVAGVRYVVTFNDPIRDGYHVLRQAGSSPFLKVQPEESAAVVADLEAWLRQRGSFVPRTREIFGGRAK